MKDSELVTNYCRMDLETLQMKDNELVSNYCRRAMGLVNKVPCHGEVVEDNTIVLKILSSMAPKF